MHVCDHDVRPDVAERPPVITHPRQGPPRGGASLLDIQRTAGNKAVQRLVAAPAVVPGVPIVQRLMSVDRFQDSSASKHDDSIFSKGRNKVLPIDQSLARYHGMDFDEPLDKMHALNAVIVSCTQYLDMPDKKAKRKPGVRTLLAEARVEMDFVRRIVEASQGMDPLDEIEELIQVQDEYVARMLRGGDVEAQGFSQRLADLISTRAGRLSAEDKRAFMMSEVGRLRRLAVDTGTPLTLRLILNEILENVADTDMMPGPSGAGFREGEGKTYFLMSNVKKEMGTGERMGVMVHELTHIATSEAFGNTEMMWAFKSTMADTDVKTLADNRVDTLTRLINLIPDIPGLVPGQQNLLRNQLEYAKRPNLMADANSLTEEELARFNRLVEMGANMSALVEYDTNINQCLMLMHSWNVPRTNAFYMAIEAAAFDAYTARQNGR